MSFHVLSLSLIARLTACRNRVTDVLVCAAQLGGAATGSSTATAGPAKPHALANGSASHAEGPAAKRQRTEGSGGGAAAAASVGDARMLDPLTAPPPDLLMEEVLSEHDAPDVEVGADDLLKVRIVSLRHDEVVKIPHNDTRL